jgi:hypothetical protein
MTQHAADDSRQSTAGYACIAGGLLGAAAAVLALTYSARVSDHTWSYPFTSGFFVAFSIVLAVTHLLVLVGILAVRRLTAGPGGPAVNRGLLVVSIGFVLLAGCEIASGTIGDKDIHSSVAKGVGTGFGISSLLIAIGSLVAAVVLLRRHVGTPVVAWSLIANAVILIALVNPAAIASNDTLRVWALTAWSLCFLPIGLTLARESAPAEVAAAPA